MNCVLNIDAEGMIVLGPELGSLLGERTCPSATSEGLYLPFRDDDPDRFIDDQWTLPLSVDGSITIPGETLMASGLAPGAHIVVLRLLDGFLLAPESKDPGAWVERASAKTGVMSSEEFLAFLLANTEQAAAVEILANV